MSKIEKYRTVIGLEVHVQLATSSKIFSSCPAEYGGSPNQFTDPLTLAMPGTLPVVNEKAIKYAIVLGLATECQIRRLNQFARKHYFYPDLPKGYQISQFEEPICENGQLSIRVTEGSDKAVRIKRIHMEEDAGKSIHSQKASLVDLNRAGTPLLEVVSEPDMSSPQEAVAYLKNLYQIVTHLQICDGNLEEGNFRCDANVSVCLNDSTEFGTRTEIKNLNSFKFLEKAIEYERNRQIELLESGESVQQATMLYDSDRNITKIMRLKEEAADYRYFPDPDLPPIEITDEVLNQLRSSMTELPSARRKRFCEKFELSEYDATVLTDDRKVADFFESALEFCDSPKILCNWITSELFSALKTLELDIEDSSLTPQLMGELVSLIETSSINGKTGKSLLQEIIKSGESPKHLVEKRGLKQLSSKEDIMPLVRKCIDENQNQYRELLAGKDSLMGFFVGQVMKLSKGKANPKMVNEIIRSEIEKDRNP